MCSDNNDSVQVAYHESGHMVVAYVLGGDLTSVSVSPRQSSFALGKSDYLGKATAFMAGGEAEERAPHFDPRDMIGRTSDDWKQAKKAGKESGLTGEDDIVDLIQQAIDRACVIVDREWSAVETLAKALIKKNKLQGPEVIAIIKPHIVGEDATQ